MTPQAVNATDVYRRAGYLTAEGPIPFVGGAHVLAGPDSNGALVVVAFSFPNRSLTFAHDGDQYRAAHDVSYDVPSGTTTIQHRSARSVVRVGSFRETTRSEESVIAQQVLTLAPGSYTLEITARDVGGPNTGRASTVITVPRFTASPRISVTPVYRVTPRLRHEAAPVLVANPRSTVVFGRDSLLQLYVEAYGGAAPHVVGIDVTADGVSLYTDSITLEPNGEIHSGIVRVPVSRIGLGVVDVTLRSRNAGAVPTRQAAVVRLGDELAIASFDEMVQYLRFFASSERLRALRDTTRGRRAELWTTFLRETDTSPATEDNEALRDYLRRVQAANAQFREDDVPGWLTDRGKAYTALGEPDRIAEPTGGDASGRGMTVVWEYREPHMQLVFVEQSGLGHWRMTPASQADFDGAFKRLTSCTGCR